MNSCLKLLLNAGIENTESSSSRVLFNVGHVQFKKDLATLPNPAADLEKINAFDVIYSIKVHHEKRVPI